MPGVFYTAGTLRSGYIVHVFFDIRMMHHDGLKLRKFNNKFILKPFGTLRRGTLRVLGTVELLADHEV